MSVDMYVDDGQLEDQAKVTAEEKEVSEKLARRDAKFQEYRSLFPEASVKQNFLDKVNTEQDGLRRKKKRHSRLPRTFPSGTNDRLPDKKMLKYLHDVGASHVDSFNYALEDGLEYAVNDLPCYELVLGDGRELQIWLQEVVVSKPTQMHAGSDKKAEYPSECRIAHSSYAGKLSGKLCFQSGEKITKLSVNFGQIPIMVRSKLCNLHNMSPGELVAHREDATEFGGYFIANGNERLVRHLQIPRRNHIMALSRPSFKQRGPLYTDKAVTLRSVGPDQTGHTLTLHYCVDGSTMVRVGIRKSEYFFPVVLLLKALKGAPMTSDKEIYNAVLRGAHKDGDTFVTARLEVALRHATKLKLFTAEQCRAYLGSQFRTVLAVESRSPSVADDGIDPSDVAAGDLLLRQHIFPHLNANWSRGSHEYSSAESKRAAWNKGDSARVGTEKFDLLIEMLRKLFAFVGGKCAADNQDSLNNHELLTGGHLYLSLLKERLEQYVLGVRGSVRRAYTTARSDSARELVAAVEEKAMRKAVARQPDVGTKMFYFIATGNIVSPSGLDLMQVAGFTVVAEKLNRYRYLSHFRSVHRGQFFTTMKTTTVRKLLPESWGFLCPVHTPDGTPCGLLNHLAAQAAVVTHQPRDADALRVYCQAAASPGQAILDGDDNHSVAQKKKRRDGSTASLAPSRVDADDAGSLISPLAQLIKRLIDWGVTPAGPRSFGIVPHHTLSPVFVDGRLVGHAPLQLLRSTVVPRLRRAKVAALRLDTAELRRKGTPHFETALKLAELATDAHAHYSATLEVSLVNPMGRSGGLYPGLFLFTGPARLMRPVVHLETGLVELIGNMEQDYLEIAVRAEEVRIGIDTHCEIWPTSMLSLIASLTPFSDFNQSPRNMYQCQMGKQTMGTPVHNYRFRPDNKMYRIQTPQAPVVQTGNQATYSMDEYPNGTNAVVAVISYTGYDMEDAMILNKSSMERGFAHATMYKTKIVDLTDRGNEKSRILGNVHTFGEKKGLKIVAALGLDGLPAPGHKLSYNQPLYVVIEPESGDHKVTYYMDSEDCIVDSVRVIGVSALPGLQKASITLRYRRNPVVGDKFSSRHGQKGVLSIAWPLEDMPFSETGIVPDVIINPHAFPSRMTIGMLIESMAGKAGAMHGSYEDCTPFSMQGDVPGKTAVDYFGDQLRSCGYNYHGSEPLYSGILGTELQADIYIGVVYYQRLRHLVLDKAQCRMTGPIDQITHQPVKGRKRGGGVRFGEMERDSLIAHGTSFIMKDRLLNCSDKHTTFICCGSILGVYNQVQKKSKRPGEYGEGESTVSGTGTSEIQPGSEPGSLSKPVVLTCKLCGRTDKWNVITIPFVLRFLMNELAAMGIRLSIH